MHILLNGFHIHGTSWDNLVKDQDILSLIIVFFILMTHMFD